MTEQQVFQRLAALCARGEHCRYEMEEKMQKWGIAEDVQARVLEQLTKERYVDDERYARAFVHDKITYNRWGRRKVEQALWMKRIDAAIARRVLDEVDDETYIDLLRPLLQQQRRSVSGRNDYERRMKLVKWALGRGFTMEVIRQCIDTADEDEFLD